MPVYARRLAAKRSISPGNCTVIFSIHFWSVLTYSVTPHVYPQRYCRLRNHAFPQSCYSLNAAIRNLPLHGTAYRESGESFAFPILPNATHLSTFTLHKDIRCHFKLLHLALQCFLKCIGVRLCGRARSPLQHLMPRQGTEHALTELPK